MSSDSAVDKWQLNYLLITGSGTGNVEPEVSEISMSLGEFNSECLAGHEL